MAQKRKAIGEMDFSKKAKHWIVDSLSGLYSFLDLIPLESIAAEQQKKKRDWVGAYPVSKQGSYYIRGVLQEQGPDQTQDYQSRALGSNPTSPSPSSNGSNETDEQSKPYQLEPYTKPPQFTAPDFRPRSTQQSWSPFSPMARTPESDSTPSSASPTTSTRSLVDEPIYHHNISSSSNQKHTDTDQGYYLQPSTRFGSVTHNRFEESTLLRARPRIYASKAHRTTSLLQSKYNKDESLARQRLYQRYSPDQPRPTQNRLRAALDATIGVLRAERESHTSSRKPSVTSFTDDKVYQRPSKEYNGAPEDKDFERVIIPRRPAWLRTKYQGNREPAWLTNVRNLINRNLPSVEQQPRSDAHQAIVDEHARIEKELAERRRAEQFKKLSDEDERRIKETLSDGYEQVVSEGFNVTILKKDIHTLRPGEWLNDEVINFYGNLIMARSKEAASLPKVHVFSTFFYKTLSENGYDKVRRWTKKVKIFEMDYVLIPIHCSGNHWTTAVIDMANKRIEYYDSLLGNNPKCFLILRGYLERESQDKLKKPFDFEGWENDCPKDIPRQKNGFDCGVFTCMFIEFKSRGMESFDFSQQNMPYLRKKIILSLINKSL